MIYIEHNGTAAHNRLSNLIYNLVDSLTEFPIEYTVNYAATTVNLSFAQDNQELPLGSFYDLPSREMLELHLNLFL